MTVYWTLETLLKARAKALRLNLGFQVAQAEALLDEYFPGWELN